MLLGYFKYDCANQNKLNFYCTMFPNLFPFFLYKINFLTTIPFCRKKKCYLCQLDVCFPIKTNTTPQIDLNISKKKMRNKEEK